MLWERQIEDYKVTGRVSGNRRNIVKTLLEETSLVQNSLQYEMREFIVLEVWGSISKPKGDDSSDDRFYHFMIFDVATWCIAWESIDFGEDQAPPAAEVFGENEGVNSHHESNSALMMSAVHSVPPDDDESSMGSWSDVEVETDEMSVEEFQNLLDNAEPSCGAPAASIKSLADDDHNDHDGNSLGETLRMSSGVDEIQDVTCEAVAELFVKTYYRFIEKCPHLIYQFYDSDSSCTVNDFSLGGREVRKYMRSTGLSSHHMLPDHNLFALAESGAVCLSKMVYMGESLYR